MELPVLIEYGLQHITGGARRNTRVHEVVHLDVAEASEAEAPVAISWNDIPDAVQTQYWGAYQVDADAHTRWHAGLHWRPLLASELDRTLTGSSAVDAETLRGLVASKTPYHSLLGNSYPHQPPVPRKLPAGEPEDRFGTVVRTERGSVIKAAMEKLARLLVVGDEVYIRCVEPTIVPYYARTDSWAHKFLRIVTSEPEINRAFARTPDDVYPVSAFEEAMTAKHLFSPPAVTAVDATRRPEIHLWDSVNEDALLHEAADVKVRNFVTAMKDVRLGETTCDQIESIAAIRRSVALPNNEERLERLELALRRCVEAWADEYHDHESLTQLADAISARRLEVPFSPAISGVPRP
ncbi:hypothetical protein HFO56_01835 [Rhizobium laguerreae]|uniref:hypothetical protein n=1 Tax=Rhizobium laguerreae TaxID=1076926 RepID=UPI001C91AB52|nr:hypothetical protein [Rhizobium laguerreae]MBY3151147.1 hypothetical protein [Rhizobium laguerreae]